MSKHKKLKKAAKKLKKVDREASHKAARYRERPALKLSGWLAEAAMQARCPCVDRALLGKQTCSPFDGRVGGAQSSTSRMENVSLSVELRCSQYGISTLKLLPRPDDRHVEQFAERDRVGERRVSGEESFLCSSAWSLRRPRTSS